MSRLENSHSRSLIDTLNWISPSLAVKKTPQVGSVEQNNFFASKGPMKKTKLPWPPSTLKEKPNYGINSCCGKGKR
jgi:hypothetical protein